MLFVSATISFAHMQKVTTSTMYVIWSEYTKMSNYDWKRFYKENAAFNLISKTLLRLEVM